MKVCGIYAIKIGREDKPDKVYVGQSSDFQSRRRYHLSRLRRGVHSNPHLQAAFSKYGEQATSFQLVVEAPESELDRIEDAILEVLHGHEFCMNIDRRSRGRAKTSNETRAKMSASHLGKKKSPDHIRKVALSNRVATDQVIETFLARKGGSCTVGEIRSRIRHQEQHSDQDVSDALARMAESGVIEMEENGRVYRGAPVVRVSLTGLCQG